MVLAAMLGCSGAGTQLSMGNAGLGQDGNDDDDSGRTPWDPIGTTGTAEEEGEDEKDVSTGTVWAGSSEETGVEPPPEPIDCVTDDDCMVEDENPCTVSPGVCELGQCYFDPKPAGEPCDDGDACTQDEACNDAGECVGTVDSCDVDHGVGVCDSAEGCAGPLECDAGWSDCDDDASNGCEIPAGVPNQCDVNGLNPNGCWTAHCGASAHADARNFGSWYCFECTNCNIPAVGTERWCSHETGLWYPNEPGNCVVDSVDYEDLVCTP